MRHSTPPSPWKFPPWENVADYLDARELVEHTSSPAPATPLFTQLSSKETGLKFHNQLDRKNIKNYLLTGAGLAVGDIDQNDLPDLFLVSQDGPYKLRSEDGCQLP